MLGCRGDTPPRFGTENLGFIPGQARSEGGNEVLPIVFPDGSTAELVYPTDLQLDQLSVRPDLTGGAPGEMVRPQIYYGGLPFRVTGPVGCIEGRDGESLPVWRWEDRENLIVLRTGQWHIAIFEGFTDLELWAQHLRGKDREGWLELNGDDELEVGPEQNPADASLMFSDADNILNLWPLDCQTSSNAQGGRVENVGKAEKFTSFCIDEVNVEVHAQGQPSFVQAVAAGVQVRNLRSRFPIDHYQIVP